MYSGVPDVRWDDNDLACIKNFHVSDLEVVDNSVLEVSAISGQTQPYVVAGGAAGRGGGGGIQCGALGGGREPGNPAVDGIFGTLPPGLTLDAVAGTITGTPGSPGPYSLGITATDISSGHASQPQAFSLVVTGAGNSPVAITSLANSASGAAGTIAPGELVTIKGAMLGPATGVSFSSDPVATSLAGTQVFFGAWPAPILYASATQINAIVPWEVAGQSQVTVEVQYAGAGSASVIVPVANAAPGVFTSDSSGAGQAVALNQDDSPNGPTNPAAAGSYVTVLFHWRRRDQSAGRHRLGNRPGARTPVQSVTATVGNVLATVTFAGAAPALVNGVNQLNIQLSAGTPTGDSAAGDNGGKPGKRRYRDVERALMAAITGYIEL